MNQKTLLHIIYVFLKFIFWNSNSNVMELRGENLRKCLCHESEVFMIKSGTCCFNLECFPKSCVIKPWFSCSSIQWWELWLDHENSSLSSGFIHKWIHNLMVLLRVSCHFKKESLPRGHRLLISCSVRGYLFLGALHSFVFSLYLLSWQLPWFKHIYLNMLFHCDALAQDQSHHYQGKCPWTVISETMNQNEVVLLTPFT